MREMESKDKTKCFICCNKILNPEDCNFRETVDVNVLIIFMLRNLLEIPKSLCENLLSRKGNPSDWVQCCPFCVSLTRRAQTTFTEKMELEQKFNRLKLKIRSTALHQWRLSNEIPNEKHKNDFADEIIRNIFLSHNEETVKLGPDLFTTLIKEDIDDDTFEDAESSVHDSFLCDNISDNDEIGDNCSLSRLRKRRVNNYSEKLKKEKCTNPSLESISKNEVCTNFDPDDPYVCAECGQRFPYIHLKEVHQRKHHKNVKCDEELLKQKYQKTVNKCNKNVLKQKHQKNVIKCDECDAFFKTRKALSKHQGDCHTQELSDVDRNSNTNVQEIQLKLTDFTNIENTDSLNSLHSESKPAESEVNDKDIVMEVEKEKTMRPKRAKKAVTYKKKAVDSDSEYSPEDDSESDFEKEAFEPGSSDSDMSDSDTMKPINKERQTETTRIPKCLSKLASITSELPFKCNDCEMSFEYSHLQKLHRLKEHNIEMQCEECDSKFETRKDWSIHCQKIHPGISYPGVRFRCEATSMKCPVCGEVLNPGSIKVHLQAHESISCYICNKTFARICELVRHQQKFHYKECNLIPIQCPQCEKIFATRDQLKKHVISWHTKEYPESCPICNKGLFSRDVKKHIQRMHTQTKPFVCSFCGKGFSGKCELEAHEIKIHTKKFKFTCDVCGKQFAQNYALVKHTSTHLNCPKPFVCELCGDSFPTKSILQIHQRGQHYKELNLEPFQCLECGIIYSGPSGLHAHNDRIHKKDPKHVCADCGEKFIDRGSLQNHILRCHGEKKFCCSSCDKRYFTKKQLQKHVQRYHTKDFSFKCTLCPLGYSDTWSFNRHMKLIHGQDKDKDKDAL